MQDIRDSGAWMESEISLDEAPAGMISFIYMEKAFLRDLIAAGCFRRMQIIVDDGNAFADESRLSLPAA